MKEGGREREGPCRAGGVVDCRCADLDRVGFGSTRHGHDAGCGLNDVIIGGVALSASKM